MAAIWMGSQKELKTTPTSLLKGSKREFLTSLIWKPNTLKAGEKETTNITASCLISMGTHRTFLHCFKQMSDSFPSQQQPSQPLPAKETTWKKERPMSIWWILCLQNHPPANGAWQMIQQISHRPKYPLQLPPGASKNHCQKRADFHALNLICGRGSSASTSLMFPGREALIKHFCPWITDKECLSTWPAVACEKLKKHCKIGFGSRESWGVIAVLSPPVQMLEGQGWPTDSCCSETA